jgi:threonine dehydratase/serine racemase
MSVSLDEVRAARERLAGWAHVTRVETCATLDRLAGRALFFKCEHVQKGGAFKFRGACNALRKLAPEVAKRGVVTHSSGNHAGALALASKMLGVPAWIVMPRTASPVKRRAVEEYGGQVIACEPNQQAREETAARVQAETGATLIPPYDHPDIIAGQGTIALELAEQVPDLDAIIAPVGGGGLMAGLCIAAHGINPRLRVLAAEPQGADDAYRSFTSGNYVPQTGPKTIADGLLTSLGELSWPVLREHLDRVITVSDEEIIAAMRLAWERAKLLIEPSSAVPLAALLSAEGKALTGLRRVAVVLSGGNVNLDALPWAGR